VRLGLRASPRGVFQRDVAAALDLSRQSDTVPATGGFLADEGVVISTEYTRRKSAVSVSGWGRRRTGERARLDRKGV
jgi:hypothetical protein